MASVVVIGAGIAGLSCAWRLMRAGHDVEVLEASAVVGGRMRSDEVDGFRLDRGASVMHGDASKLQSLASRVGLADDVVPVRGAASFAVLHEGRLESVDLAVPRAMLSGKLLSAGGKVGLMRLGLELARLRKDIDPLVPESAISLDAEGLSHTIERWAGKEIGQRLVIPFLSASYGCEVGERQSGAFLALALRWAIEQPDPHAIAGGMGRLTAELARRLPVRSGCEVTEVESHTDGVRLRYRVGRRTGTVVADAAVLAVPGNRVAGLCPKLTPGERGFFEGVSYGRGIVCQLLLDERPRWAQRGIVFPSNSAIGLHGVALAHPDPRAAPEGAAVVRATIREDAVARVWSHDDDEISSFALSELRRAPVAFGEPRSFVVHRFAEMSPQFRPGYLGRLRAFGLRGDRSPRLAFCGDYLVGPWGEGAAASGLYAASELARELES